MNEVTKILEAVEAGDTRAAEKLLPLAYDELRRIAAQKMAGERAGHTLQPTALVHEAYLRLVDPDGNQPHWNSRGHFFAAAANAMRRILVENARRKLRLKRGAGAERETWDDEAFETEVPSDDILLVHEALSKLECEHPDDAGGRRDALFCRDDGRGNGSSPGNFGEHRGASLARGEGLAAAGDL